MRKPASKPAKPSPPSRGRRHCAAASVNNPGPGRHPRNNAVAAYGFETVAQPCEAGRLACQFRAGQAACPTLWHGLEAASTEDATMSKVAQLVNDYLTGPKML